MSQQGGSMNLRQSMLAGLMLAHPYAAACGWQGCWACQYLLLRLPPQIQHCPTAGRNVFVAQDSSSSDYWWRSGACLCFTQSNGSSNFIFIPVLLCHENQLIADSEGSYQSALPEVHSGATSILARVLTTCQIIDLCYMAGQLLWNLRDFLKKPKAKANKKKMQPAGSIITASPRQHKGMNSWAVLALEVTHSALLLDLGLLCKCSTCKAVQPRSCASPHCALCLCCSFSLMQLRSL